MPPIEQQIAVRIKNFVEGLPQVQALSAAVQGLSKANGASGLKSTAAQVVNLGNVSDKTVKNLANLFTNFQNVSKGFSSGSTNVQTFTAELGGAAREMKVITDQSRLLGAAGSIQLPARNPVFQTLKPLVDSTPIVERTTRSLRTEEETVGRIAANAQRLAEAWQEGNAALKKQVELLAASQGEQTNSAFKNLINGKVGVSTGGTSPKKPIQDLNEEVEKVPKNVGEASSAISGLFRSLGRIIVISALFAAFYAIVNTIKDAIGAVEEAVKSFITTGLKYNASLETSKISLASLVAQTSDIKDEQGNLVEGAAKFAAAEQIAGKEMAKVQAIAIDTRFQFEDILQAVVLATAAVGGANVTLDQTLTIVEKLARAAAAVHLNPQQFQTQVRQILTGATRVQTTLATAVFPGQTATEINKQIKAWREAGTLVENLNKKLEVFSFTSKEVEGTFDALASNVEDAFKIFAGKSTLPLFDGVKKSLDFILHQIVVIDDAGVHLTPTFQKLADILGVIGDQVGKDILAAIKDVATQFRAWVDTIRSAPEAFRGIGDDVVSIAANIAGMIVDFVKMINYAFLLDAGGQNIRSTTGSIAELVGIIRDILRVIYGVIVLIGGVFEAVIQTGALALVEALLVIEGRLDRIGDAADIAWKKIKRIFTFGVDEIGAGLSGSDVPGIGQHVGVRGQAGLDTNFNAFPRKQTGEGKAASDRAKRDRINTLKQLNEAATELFLAQAKNEIDVQNNANEEIIKAWQRRYDQGLISAKTFYAKKEELTLENIKREESLQQQQLEAEKEKLRLNLAALEGQADISDQHFEELLNKFNNAGDRSKINPNDTLFNKQIIEFLKFQKEGAGIQATINKLAEQRKEIQTDTNSETEDSVRLNRQLADNLKGQLSDALGATGISDQIALQKRISDEVPKLLSEFGAGIPGLEEVSNVVHQLGDVSLDNLLAAFKLFNVDIDTLPEPLKNIINLFKQLTTSSDLAVSAGIISDTVDRLKFDLEGIQTGFDKGDIGLSAAVARAQEFKQTAVQQLTVEYNKQKLALDALPPATTPEEIASLDRKTRAVGALSRQIEALGNGTDELTLISADSQKANDIYSAKIEEISIKQRNFSINAVQATKQEIAAKEVLIAKLEEELAAAQLLDQTVPANAKEVADLINQIGTLQNETHAQTLDLAHGIEDSIGGAFNNFFDAIQQGNQGILDSFRSAVAGMLQEIAKLIFQAFVLKAIMSAINSFIGGFLPGAGGGGVTGGVAGDHAAGFADGGIVSGPGTGVSDSIPAMLSHGEAVIPARQVNAYGRGLISSLISGSFIPMRGFARFAEGGFAGGGSSSGASHGRGSTRIVNVVDKNLVSDFMNSSEGEHIILNVIGRNPGLIQRLA